MRYISAFIGPHTTSHILFYIIAHFHSHLIILNIILNYLPFLYIFLPFPSLVSRETFYFFSIYIFSLFFSSLVRLYLSSLSFYLSFLSFPLSYYILNSQFIYHIFILFLILILSILSVYILYLYYIFYPFVLFSYLLFHFSFSHFIF